MSHDVDLAQRARDADALLADAMRVYRDLLGEGRTYVALAGDWLDWWEREGLPRARYLYDQGLHDPSCPECAMLPPGPKREP